MLSGYLKSNDVSAVDLPFEVINGMLLCNCDFDEELYVGPESILYGVLPDNKEFRFKNFFG